MNQTPEHTSPPVTDFPYELEVLRHATKYQKWIVEKVEPYLGQSILEVGAGIGNMSRWLTSRENVWATESDPGLFNLLTQSTQGTSVKCAVWTLGEALPRELQNKDFDTIISFNVLEHIEDDINAFRQMVELLKQSNAKGPKRLITFVPAHRSLYGSLDEKFGHFRRYEMKELVAKQSSVAPTAQFKTFHFNLTGVPGWFLSGRLLKVSKIGSSMIALNERLIPIAKLVDRAFVQGLKIPFGQSICSVLQLEK